MAGVAKLTELTAGRWDRRVRVKALDSAADVLKVIFADLKFQHFLDHRQEVG